MWTIYLDLLMMHMYLIKKKIFMYVVFTTTLLTDKDKFLVRKLDEKYNNHAIHKEPLEHILI